MNNRCAAIGALVAIVAVSACAAGVSRESVQRPGSDAVFDDFQVRIDRYMTLHRRLSSGIPAERDSAGGGANRASSDVLAGRIRAARADARPGDLFTPPVAARVRERLDPVLRGSAAAEARSAIRDDAPVTFTLRVNDPYPEGASLPTVPGNVLAVLPTLPQDLEYRIVNRHLIIRDVRANIIVDYVLDVMCAKC